MSAQKVKGIIETVLYWFGWPASGGALLMLAQTEGMPSWLTGSSAISGTLVLGWFAWQTVTKTIPELQRTFREELRVEREACAEQLQKQAESHDRGMSELRNMLKESMASDRRAVHDVSDVAAVAVGQAQQAVKELKRENENK